MKEKTKKKIAEMMFWVYLVLVPFLGAFAGTVFVTRDTYIENLVIQREELDAAFKKSFKKWECRRIVSCPWSDWRYTDPEDVCEYEIFIEYFISEPTVGSGGEWCKPIIP